MEIETSPLSIVSFIGTIGDTLDAQRHRGYYSLRDTF